MVRSVLGALRVAQTPEPGAPELIVTTPSGQAHELGALMAASMASSQGWKVTYLGPNLPAEEIVAAAGRRGARAVALSVVFPADDARLYDELRRLRRLRRPGPCRPGDPSRGRPVHAARHSRRAAPVGLSLRSRYLARGGLFRPPAR
jgi:hypothetical protein